MLLLRVPDFSLDLRAIDHRTVAVDFQRAHKDGWRFGKYRYCLDAGNVFFEL